MGISQCIFAQTVYKILFSLYICVCVCIHTHTHRVASRATEWLRKNYEEIALKSLKKASLYSEILFRLHTFTFHSPGIYLNSSYLQAHTRRWAADGQISKSWFSHPFHPISSSSISTLPILLALSLWRDLKDTKLPRFKNYPFTTLLMEIWCFKLTYTS